MRCDDVLAAIAENERAARDDPAVAAHLAGCADCREQAAYLGWLAQQLAALPQEKAGAGLRERVIGRTTGGQRIKQMAEEVRYAAFDSPLGPFYVAYGDRGIVRTGLAMGEDEFAALLARLAGRVRRDESVPRRVAAVVEGFFAGKRCPPEAFDWQGLPEFERRVLLKTLEIPRGEVRPYAWVAREIGRPSAVRAVGQALGRNPVPVLIPCHRAVRSDGTLGGYAFGLPLKRRILALEGVDLDRLQREAAAGVRYHGSATTRIFCLPTCRHARRVADAHRVRFRSDEEARAAGYRPCRVCRPVAP